VRDNISFIKNINIIGIDKVPKSYQLKHEIRISKAELWTLDYLDMD